MKTENKTGAPCEETDEVREEELSPKLADTLTAIGEEFPDDLHGSIMDRVRQTPQMTAKLRILRRVVTRVAALAAALLCFVGISLALQSNKQDSYGLHLLFAKESRSQAPADQSDEKSASVANCKEYRLTDSGDFLASAITYNRAEGDGINAKGNSDSILPLENTLWVYEDEGRFDFTFADGRHLTGSAQVRENRLTLTFTLPGEDTPQTAVLTLSENGSLCFSEGTEFWK